MGSVVGEYAKVIRRLCAAEMNARGPDREVLGQVAGAIATFLRRRSRKGRPERLVVLALAERAEEVAVRCLASSHPTRKT